MPENPSDEALMKAFASGDQLAFESLHERYKQKLFNYIYGFFRNSHRTEDLLQQVFYNLIVSAQNYQPKAKFSTYLFTIAHNVCMDDFRKAGRRKTTPMSQLATPENDTSRQVWDRFVKDSRATPSRAFRRKLFADAVEEVLETLPPEQREVFILKAKMEFSIEEIATVLGCSVNTAKSRLRYAVDKIQQKLKGKFSIQDLL